MSLSDLMKKNLNENFHLGEIVIQSRVLKKYTGKAQTFTIPAEVEKIGSYAFHNLKTLKHVIIPEGVLHIRNNAFLSCEGLETVTLPESLITIGESAFCQCRNLKKIIIPGNITEIKKDTFQGCSSLEEITLPSRLDNIGTGAFQGCSHLKKIQLPEGITEIKEDMFAYCTSLQEFTIPKGVTAVREHAFWKCDALSNIDFPDSLQHVSMSFIDDNVVRIISYRGIRFFSHLIYESRFGTFYKPVGCSQCLSLIQNHDIFDTSVPTPEKEAIIFQLFVQNPADMTICSYLRENFDKDMHEILHTEDFELIRKIIGTPEICQFLSKENIDEFIFYTIDHKLYEAQVMLMNYKQQYIGYDSQEEIIRRKFEL